MYVYLLSHTRLISSWDVFFFIKYIFKEGRDIKKEALRVCFQVILQELLDLFLFLNKTENKNRSAFAIKDMTNDICILLIKEN